MPAAALWWPPLAMATAATPSLWRPPWPSSPASRKNRTQNSSTQEWAKAHFFIALQRIQILGSGDETGHSSCILTQLHIGKYENIDGIVKLIWYSIFLYFHKYFFYSIFGKKFHCAGIVGFSFHHSQHCCQFLSLHCTWNTAVFTTTTTRHFYLKVL